jgi:dihydropteroate synthase
VLEWYAVPNLPAQQRTLVMGVLNVTPDSFSDGGQYAETSAAIARGRELVADGADIVDVGGESTRPGAERIEADVEIARVIPVIRELAGEGVVVSVDTMRAAVAEAALDAGAVAVNDVSGGSADPAMAKVVGAAEVPFVVVHSRGPSVDMQSRAVYTDVVAEVASELRVAVDAAVDAGVQRSRIIVDPGLGFAKTGEHNWELLRRVDELAILGFPLLIGASRKAFLGRLLTDGDTARPVDERDDATTALTTLLAAQRVWGVRVHAVGASADAVRVVAELQRDAGPTP